MCRAFLSPYSGPINNTEGHLKWWGRFNIGLTSINLADAGLSAQGNIQDFWEILDERLDLCYRSLMLRYEKIKDVAVIGLPDKRLGEITGAVIEVKDGLSCTEQEIETYCEAMPRYKRPRKIIFAPIPRNATGKIEKPKLRRMYGAEHLVEQQNMG